MSGRCVVEAISGGKISPVSRSKRKTQSFPHLRRSLDTRGLQVWREEGRLIAFVPSGTSLMKGAVAAQFSFLTLDQKSSINKILLQASQNQVMSPKIPSLQERNFASVQHMSKSASLSTKGACAVNLRVPPSSQIDLIRNYGPGTRDGASGFDRAAGWPALQ